MDVLDRDSVAKLAQHRGWPSVSIYLPTRLLPRGTGEDRIRLKNLVREACEHLVAEGMRDPDAERTVQPVREMLEDHTFWRDTAHGLAFFVGIDETVTMRLDVTVPEQVVVGDRFYIRPLLTAHHIDESFFALALDKNDSRLFRGNRNQIEEIDLGDTTTTFQEALKFDQVGRTLTTHSFASGRISSRGNQHGGSNYAGHGNAKDADVEQTTRFARIVERGVADALKGEGAPLIVMGNERLWSAYEEVNTYPHFAGIKLGGASDYLSPQQVQARSLEALSPLFAAQLDAEIASLTENEGSSLVSHDPAEIVAAAAEGRVKTLFLDDSVGPFGVFDRDRHEVSEICDASPRLLRERKDPEISGGHGECGWDLGDLAAAETALHGGEVLAFVGEEPPVSGIAAVYRY